MTTHLSCAQAAASPRLSARLFCGLLFVTFVLRPISGLPQRLFRKPARSDTVTVEINTNHPVNRFIPARALGAGVDGHSEGETQRQLSRPNVAAMLSAGLKPLTYRLRTELAGEAWHWNPKGAWSDAAYHRGYWTSDSDLSQPINVCYGYRLPRRGNTIDQANDDGYSRIDDGNPESFWKSNPYLDEHYTKEKNSLHPQWVMIDLGARKKVNAIKILWTNPFATRYEIEYGHFVGAEDLSQRLPTVWKAFPNGQIKHGSGGGALFKVARRALRVRYVRIRLDESSEAAPNNSPDIRDRLGYAIGEIYLGWLGGDGRLKDEIHHAAGRAMQTVIYVSSTDPWHREIDRDPDTEQPGFDFIFASGLTNGLSVMVPVPVLYDTPEKGAAEIQYLAARGYPVERVELGEEPDGQFVTAEHYGALYMQFYKALNALNPRLQFGGPSLQDIERSEVPGRVEFGKGGWMGAFLRYLSNHGSLDEFSFFSFEWYPFAEDCKRRQLARLPQMLADALHELQLGGLTHGVPWIITEFGYSAFGARAEVDIDAAVLNAESVAHFLTLGGNAAYLYGYEASEVIREQECSSGNNMLFFRDENGQIRERTAAYWGARLLTQEWTQPSGDWHEIYPAITEGENKKGERLVTAYPLLRPDGLWSLLLINLDLDHAYSVRVRFQSRGASSSGFSGPVDLFQFSRAQYQLNSDEKAPYPIKAGAPAHTILPSANLDMVHLPAFSLTVIRGAGPQLPRLASKLYCQVKR